MKFIQLLNDVYQDEKNDFGNDKYEFISCVFNFVTYDNGEGSASNYLCDKMIEVIRSILDEKTFEYQEKSHENYLNYITMVNMPFLSDKLDWGTSIRGAWFEKCRPMGKKSKPVIHDLGIEWSIKFTIEETEEFMRDLIYWWDNF